MKTQKRVSIHWNLLKLPTKITGGKTKEPSRTTIHYHLYPNSTISSWELDISLNQINVGDMTTNISKTKINGRWPRRTGCCSNQRSYAPAHILQRHPRSR